MKEIVKKLIPANVWKAVREKKIVTQHAKVASLCDKLADEYFETGESQAPSPLKDVGTQKIIWQYWAQGYDDVPSTVRECLDSVVQYKGDYLLIRLDDSNVNEFIDIPEPVSSRIRNLSLAHYSDLLRVALLSAYGGVWLDATVKLTGPLPQEYSHWDCFMYRRDPLEKNRNYWENTYAYYFCWAEKFRVNVLSSIIFASKGSAVTTALYGILVLYWTRNENLPDYFFLQILYDVLINGRLKQYACPIVSDCTPHLLQQYRNDPSFNLMTQEEIFSLTTIHKLTYKNER